MNAVEETMKGFCNFSGGTKTWITNNDVGYVGGYFKQLTSGIYSKYQMRRPMRSFVVMCDDRGIVFFMCAKPGIIPPRHWFLSLDDCPLG